jgi:hypothetical protein
MACADSRARRACAIPRELLSVAPARFLFASRGREYVDGREICPRVDSEEALLPPPNGLPQLRCILDELPDQRLALWTEVLPKVPVPEGVDLMAHVRTHKRGDGSAAYEVRWRQAGRFKQRTFKVRRDAERFALRVEDEVEQGNSTDIYVRRSNTVREVVEASMKAAEGKLKPNTLAGYELAYRLHLLPTFGTRRVTSVTSQDVERWVAELSAKGLSPASVRGTFVALNKGVPLRPAARPGRQEPLRRDGAPALTRPGDALPDPGAGRDAR